MEAGSGINRLTRNAEEEFPVRCSEIFRRPLLIDLQPANRVQVANGQDGEGNAGGHGLNRNLRVNVFDRDPRDFGDLLPVMDLPEDRIGLRHLPKGRLTRRFVELDRDGSNVDVESDFVRAGISTLSKDGAQRGKTG